MATVERTFATYGEHDEVRLWAVVDTNTGLVTRVGATNAGLPRLGLYVAHLRITSATGKVIEYTLGPGESILQNVPQVWAERWDGCGTETWMSTR